MIKFERTQDTKPLITASDGTVYVDLLKRDISVKDIRLGPVGINYYLVTEDTAMRPDLISNAMYNYNDNAEKVLKFNGFSNPLSIDIDDILVVYDPYSMERNMRSESDDEINKVDIRKQYLTPEKKSKIDPNLKAFDNRTNALKDPDPTKDLGLPPNYADFGDQEIEIRNGKLVFGPNVSKNKKACEDPISKSEFIARLIKNRLNNEG